MVGEDASIVHILHDEVIVEAGDDIADAVAVTVKNCMEGSIQRNIAARADDRGTSGQGLIESRQRGKRA